MNQPDLFNINNTSVISTNCNCGRSTLNNGSITVSNQRVTSKSIICCSHQTISGTLGILYVTNIITNTSFKINSTSNLDNSVIGWHIIETV